MFIHCQNIPIILFMRYFLIDLLAKVKTMLFNFVILLSNIIKSIKSDKLLCAIPILTITDSTCSSISFNSNETTEPIIDIAYNGEIFLIAIIGFGGYIIYQRYFTSTEESANIFNLNQAAIFNRPLNNNNNTNNDINNNTNNITNNTNNNNENIPLNNINPTRSEYSGVENISESLTPPSINSNISPNSEIDQESLNVSSTNLGLDQESLNVSSTNSLIAHCPLEEDVFLLNILENRMVLLIILAITIIYVYKYKNNLLILHIYYRYLFYYYKKNSSIKIK